VAGHHKNAGFFDGKIMETEYINDNKWIYDINGGCSKNCYV
jgi:hypothetical protein